MCGVAAALIVHWKLRKQLLYLSTYNACELAEQEEAQSLCTSLIQTRGRGAKVHVIFNQLERSFNNSGKIQNSQGPWGRIRNSFASSIRIHAASRSNPAALTLISFVSSTPVPPNRQILFLPEEFSRHFHYIRHGPKQSSPRIGSEGPPGHQGEQPEPQSEGTRGREGKRVGGGKLGCDLA